MIFALICPVFVVVACIKFFGSAARRAYSDARLRAVAARLTEEQDRLRAAETPPVDDRPAYRPVELQPSLVAMMKRDGFI